LTDAGFAPENIDTRCDITMDVEKGLITNSHLTVKARVPGLEKARFDELVAEAKANCPVSKVLNAEISCVAQLE
jgi:osmotically inducible protein OsmC